MRRVLGAVGISTAICAALSVLPSVAHAGTVVTRGPSGAGCDGVRITPDDNPQSILEEHPAGTTFCFSSGTHRLTEQLIPSSGDVLAGEPGAILSGAEVAANLTPSGDHWVSSGWESVGGEHGDCEGDYRGCAFPEQVFVDGEPLWRVTDLADLAAGGFYFDSEAGKVHIAADPNGHVIEVTRLNIAITAAKYAASDTYADDVVVRDLVIEKFGNDAQLGAIDTFDGQRWTIRNNEIRLNHGAGVCTNGGSRVLRNKIHHNGQLGICGHGSNIVVGGNEIAFNNIAGFDAGWEGGGSKWVRTTNLIVRNNYVHDNKGPGLWTDTDNVDTVFRNNVVDDNDGPGIFHEVSYRARIVGNRVSGNGFGWSAWLWGGGIVVAASPDVEIAFNRVTGNADGIALIQQDRGAGDYGPYVLKDVHVHDNTVVLEGDAATGLVQDTGDRAVFVENNNRFNDNNYSFPAGDDSFEWMNGMKSATEWRAFGNDVDGIFEGI